MGGSAWEGKAIRGSIAYPVNVPTARPWLRPQVGAAAVAGLACVIAFATASATTEAPPPAARSAPAATSGTPAGFIANEGQRAPRVLYEAHTSGMTVTLERRALRLSLAGAGDLSLRFVGAEPTRAPTARGALPGRVNYLVGAPVRHRTGLTLHRQVTYPELWPGIDMVFRLSGGRLRYELVVHPGADPERAKLAWRGAREVSLTAGGALRLDTAAGALIDAAPRTFQRISGRRVAVPSRYDLGSGGRLGFEVGNYDRRHPLVIDPELAWSTYLGGLGADVPEDVAVDREGYPYVAGVTNSTDFPVTPGAPDRFPEFSEAFVTKLQRDGSGIVWSTFLGGSDFYPDAAEAVAVDRHGAVYVGGHTYSNDFPVTPGALDSQGNDFLGDGFVTKLSSDGSRLEYSTHFGDRGIDVRGIDVDRDGNAVVGGRACCTGVIPTTPGAFQGAGRGWDDAFAAKLNADGTGLIWGTMLGGPAFDWGDDLALGRDGSVYLVGDSNAPPSGFPVTPGAFDVTHNGGNHDGFVARLTPDGSGLVYASFLGSTVLDDVSSVAVDRAGNAYVGGIVPCCGTGFPVTPGAFDTTRDSGEGFVVKVSAAGDRVVWGTYLGGSSYFDNVDALAVDAQGSVYAGGITISPDFPTTPGAFQRTNGGGFGDGFVAKLDPSGSRLIGSTFIGGGDEDWIHGLALDRPGTVFVAGETRSSNFPTTPGAYDRALAVPNPPPSSCCVIDGFAARIIIRPGPPAAIALSPADSAGPVEEAHCVTAAVEDAFGGRLAGVQVGFDVTGAASTSGSAVTNTTGEAVFCYQGPALPGEDVIRAVVDSDGDGAPAEDEPEAVATKRWTPPPSTAGCKVKATGRITTTEGPAVFSSHVLATATGGEGTVRYRTRSFSLRAIRITSARCESSRASVFGDAAIVGSRPVGFRIDAVDRRGNGGLDTYQLRLADGYDSGAQSLKSGNVRVK